LSSSRIMADTQTGDSSTSKIRRISHHGETPLAGGVFGPSSSSSRQMPQGVTKMSCTQSHRYDSSNSETEDTTWTDDASFSSSPTHKKTAPGTAAVSRSAAVVHAGDNTVSAQHSSWVDGSSRQQLATRLNSNPHISKSMAALDKPYKLTLADIAHGRALARGLTKTWVAPDGSRRKRKPDDLAPHIAKLQDTHRVLMTVLQLHKATARRGNRRPSCRTIAATGTRDICCA
jgi:hypothetical protein